MKKDRFNLVFLIEDDRFMRQWIKQQMERKSNTIVMTFSSAESAIGKMGLHPDLILLDFFLDSDNPENMNGHEAVNALLKKDPQVPIVFISGESNENLLLEYQEYRSIPHITKNAFNLDRLHITVQQYMRESA